jgi:hypothetical protein
MKSEVDSIAKFAILGMLGGFLVAPGCSSNSIPIKALQSADTYEVLSLDPTDQSEEPADSFHGWRVLGRTVVNDTETRHKLNEALRKGAEEYPNYVSACFIPRHGVRVTHGEDVVDLAVCFECLHAEVFENNVRENGFPISEVPQAVFDELLRSKGIPLAAKSK